MIATQIGRTLEYKVCYYKVSNSDNQWKHVLLLQQLRIQPLSRKNSYRDTLSTMQTAITYIIVISLPHVSVTLGFYGYPTLGFISSLSLTSVSDLSLMLFKFTNLISPSLVLAQLLCTAVIWNQKLSGLEKKPLMLFRVLKVQSVRKQL